MPSLPPPVWIANPAALARLVKDLERQPRVAVDTESNSLHAYREQVCLIQFSTPETDYLVDPFSLDDLSSLGPIFADPNIEKVFHAVEYDQLCLQRDFGFTIVNLFDTMQASRILGYPQVGLDALLAQKFEIVVDKRHQKADWGRRPLPSDQLNYARFDTHYLLALRDLLQAELESAGKWQLACEEFQRLAKGSNGGSRPEVPPWQRIGAARKMRGEALSILQELSLWRETAASRLDRPPFKMLDDHRLVAIAENAPKNMKELAASLTPAQVNRFGNEVLRAVERGRKGKPMDHPPRPKRPSSAYLRRMDLLNQWRKDSAKKMHLESDIILPKGWMHAIAEKNPQNMEQLAELMPGSPWRLELLGAEILKVIAPRAKK